MKLIKLSALLMDNGEILCLGKNLGYEKDLKKAILQDVPETLESRISEEEQSLTDMLGKNANIPEGWSIAKQEGFVAGLKYARSIIITEKVEQYTHV